MADIRNYTCPNCGAPLRYDPKESLHVCDSCSGRYRLETLETLENGDSAGFDWGSYAQNLSGETLENTRVYICEACGAEIESDGNTAATKCPYCDNNVVLTNRVSGSLKPNALIPFRITPEELHAAIKAFYRKKRLLPSTFFTKSQLADIQGIYVPFWLFDAKLDGTVIFKGSRTRSYVSGNYKYTETSYYLLEREGSMEFTRVPVDASTKMPDDLMDSLEPFDYSELVDFNDGYLAGYLADRFDSSPDAELNRAEQRMRRSAESVMKENADLSNVETRVNALHLEDAGVRYVLLPVYLVNCTFGGKQYRYAVNGQTGKVVGELPISKSKCWGWFLRVFAIAAAAVTAVGLLVQ